MTGLKKILRDQHQNTKTWITKAVKRHREWKECLQCMWGESQKKTKDGKDTESEGSEEIPELMDHTNPQIQEEHPE